MTIVIRDEIRDLIEGLDERLTAIEEGNGPVETFNGRGGVVTAEPGDYSLTDVGMTVGQTEAIAGTIGTPSISNKFVTEDDVAIDAAEERIPRATLQGYLDPSWFALRIEKVTGPATKAGVTHTLYFCDVSSGAVTLSLPSPGLYREVQVKLTTTADNTVTVDPGLGTTVDGESELILDTDFEVVRLVSDGDNWFKV